MDVSQVREELAKFPQKGKFMVTVYDDGDMTTTHYEVAPLDLMPDGRGNCILHIRKPLFL